MLFTDFVHNTCQTGTMGTKDFRKKLPAYSYDLENHLIYQAQSSKFIWLSKSQIHRACSIPTEHQQYFAIFLALLVKNNLLAVEEKVPVLGSLINFYCLPNYLKK